MNNGRCSSRKLRSLYSLPLTLLAALIFGIALQLQGQSSEAKSDFLIIVPHTHWEGAVFKTREEYLQIGLPHILKALSLMQRYPQYRYVLDQMAYIKPFLERYPNEVATFKKVLDEHRLEIAGGTVVMEDENVPSAESIAHQFLLAKWYFRDRLGYEVQTGWGLDTFGHNAQMPQILRLAGMKSYWFQRGVSNPQTPTDIKWQGIDGTTIPGHWLPTGYGPFDERLPTFQNFEATIRSCFDALTPFWRGPGRVLFAGGDVTDPDESLPLYVDQWNYTKGEPFFIQLGTPSEFEALRAKHPFEPPLVVGDLNPIFQGTYSTRIELKRWMRDMERTLTSAEKASVLTGRTSSSDREEIERAWDPVLFNQTHDLSSGVMLDHVYQDVLAGYQFAKRAGDEILGRDLDSLLAKVDTRGPGMPLAIFNFLGWDRTDYVEADVGFSLPKVRGIELQDAAGKAVPVQVLRSHSNGGDGGLSTATIAFVARDVPAMGYAIYHAIPILEGASVKAAPRIKESTPIHEAQPASTSRDDFGTMDNEFYRVTVNLWTGEMTSLVLKKNQWEVLSKSGNVVAREEDRGDFWELYGTLSGDRLTTEKRLVGLPRPNATQWSNDYVGGGAEVSPGPVVTEFSSSHPFGKNQFETRVRMYSGIQRIDIRTDIVNEEPFVRYRVLFPTTIHDGKNTQEIAFGAVERPVHQEFPAQTWVDYSGDGRGLAVLNRGLPGNNVTDDTMMVSLLRSTHLQVYGADDSGFDPAKASESDTALELGRRMSHDYALVPHTGSWQEAQVYRAGLEFNNPLIVRSIDAHAGSMPERWGLLEVSAPNAVVSALKPSRDGQVALRIYEGAGQSVQHAKVHFALPLASAREANLIEDSGKQLEIKDNVISFDLHPYEIRTFRLRFAAQ
jgi:alpha-mannosidase